MVVNNSSYSFLDYRSNIWIPFFLGITIIITVGLYLHFPSGYNQGIYHYQGLVIKNGGLPYTDFIEKKGPMGLLTYALAAIFFGETAIAFRAFDLIILTCIGIFLFRLVRLNYSKLTSWLVSVIWLHHVLIDGPGNTGDVTNIITACYVALAYYMLAPKVKNRYLISGILIALACWVKPTAILIAMPLLLPFFYNNEDRTSQFKCRLVFRFLLGMLIPSAIFMFYLLITNSFYAFWESVVIDTIFNYSGYVSRFSSRTILKTGWTFLNDPFLRIGGILGLFIFSKNKIIKLLVVGIGLMLFVEGRFYPYQFSILWPFLTIGLVEGFMVLCQKFSVSIKNKLVALFCLIMAFPAFKVGSTFINAGFLTENFKAEQTFIFSDFKDMYRQRQPVISYLEKQLNEKSEILVLGQDPNIYLELGVITTCRLAREGKILTGKLTAETPSHLIAWQEELLKYMDDTKADKIILLKTLSNSWIDSYSDRINSIFSEKYTLEYETEGHLIYKK